MASPPQYLTPVSREDIDRGDGPIILRFLEDHTYVTKESLGGRVGSQIKVRPWQVNILNMMYARREDGRYTARRALLGLPRKNGKSAIGSALALYGLIGAGDGAEVYSCAADKEQAKIVFGVAKRMMELDPTYQQLIKQGDIKLYRDVIEMRRTGSTYKALSAEAYTKEGLNPSLVMFDELHAQPNDELYDVMSNAFGARVSPLLVMITTAGVKTDPSGLDSICYRLYQYGQDIASGTEVDPSFFMAWWGAAETDDPGLSTTWAKANPGYGDLLDPEDFESNYRQAVAKGTVNDFKTKRLNMWVDSSRAWLPDGAWDQCATMDDFVVPERGVVLGFDGSRNGDNTALVAVTVEPEPKVKVLGLWARPDGDMGSWRVPRAEVKDAIRSAFRNYKVAELAYDSYLWQDAMEELEQEFPERIVEFPQTMARMAPATQRFYELVQNQKIRHDGDSRLRRHLSNAQIKTDERGSRLVKDARNSPRKIDLAIAAVMAADRAAYYLQGDAPGFFKGRRTSDIKFVW